MKDLPILSLPSQQAFQEWIAAQPADSDGLWLKIAKKGSGIATVSYPEALEVALCYGWIDAQARSSDDSYWLQRFCPRRPRSKWSKVNREHVARLTAEGRMQPAGLAEVERAKADGRWDAAYDAPSTATIPTDLQHALDANPRAAAFFATLNSTNRYAILHRIQDAKKPETRARRIEGFITMLAEGRKLY